MDILDGLVKLPSRPYDVIVKSALPDPSKRISCLADLPLRQDFDPHHDVRNGAAFIRKNYRMPMIGHEAVGAECKYSSISNHFDRVSKH